MFVVSNGLIFLTGTTGANVVSLIGAQIVR